MAELIDFISKKRLEKYGDSTKQKTCDLYFFNVRLSESFYPSLSQFEVVLRNKVDLVLSRHMGKDWIFERVRNDEKYSGGDMPEDRDKLVDSLTFAFWSRLFMDENRKDIWGRYPSALREIFENRREALDLKKISFEIDQIRQYRNRFSHNGSLLICHKRHIPCEKMHNVIFRIMKELDANAVLNRIKKIDRFNEVYTDGRKSGFIKGKK